METKAEKSKHFTSLDYYSKRDSKMNFFHALQESGWKMYGYHEDKSDSMTDYFSPEHWDGIAVKQGYVLCVDVYSTSDSGKPIMKIDEKWTSCAMCQGVGSDPEGWSLTEAREKPQAYNVRKMLRQYPGSIAISDTEIMTASGHKVQAGLSGVVSPIGFHTNGYEKCRTCYGRGETLASSESRQVDAWPSYQANPKRKAWHLEKDGVILTSGMTIARLYAGYYDGTHEAKREAIKAAAAELIAALDSAMNSSNKAISDIPAVAAGGIELINYSAKSFALKGHTKPYKDELGRGGLGGIFNSHLKEPATGETFAGWIFAVGKLPDVLKFLERIKGQWPLFSFSIRFRFNGLPPGMEARPRHIARHVYSTRMLPTAPECQ